MRLSNIRRGVAAFVIALSCIVSNSSRAGEPSFPMGMNLAGVADWSSEIVFVDAFKISRPWLSQREGSAFGKGGDLPLDARGWPKKIDVSQFAEALLHVDIEGHYPGGNYVCLFEGKGKIEFSNAAQGRLVGPNKYAVSVDPKRGFIALRVRDTDAKNPVKNIRLVKAEHEKTYQAQPFNPEFLKRYKGFQVIRFMDWQKTNNSKIAKWEDRARLDDATQTGPKGVALEHCIQLANALDADPWFCLPHLADDDYVRNFATMVKDKVNAKHKIYVEYSNETWNTIFEQSKYCRANGLKAELSKNPYEAQLRFSAQRSLEIFKIFEEVFGGKERLIRVLAAHGAHLWTGTTAMDWNDAYKGADAIAIAPYFGNAFGDPKTADKVADMPVVELLEGCEKMVAKNRESNAKYAEEAKKRGLKLLAYESGQHLVGYNGAENNQKLMNLFHEANRHPKMKELYLEDLKNWYDVGGQAFCVFSSMGRYTKWGSWGVMEWFDQKESDAPKMAALREWMKAKK